MNFFLEVQPRAREELRLVVLDYLSLNYDRAVAFDAAVNATFDFLLETPFGCAIWQGSVRRINIKGFPYALLYAIELRDPDVAHVVIISCIHQHSDPRRWPTRPE